MLCGGPSDANAMPPPCQRLFAARVQTLAATNVRVQVNVAPLPLWENPAAQVHDAAPPLLALLAGHTAHEATAGPLYDPGPQAVPPSPKKRAFHTGEPQPPQQLQPGWPG